MLLKLMSRTSTTSSQVSLKNSQVAAQVAVQPAEQFGVHTCHASGSLTQPLPIRVLAYRQQDLAHRSRDAGLIDLGFAGTQHCRIQLTVHAAGHCFAHIGN